MLLQPHQRTKLDESDDGAFYEWPRFVTHVDDEFIRQLTQLYRDRLQSGMRVLDLMSSWVSHLPEDLEFETVEGHGLNEAELQKNPQLHGYFVQNLNQNPQLPYPDDSFDAVLIAVSVQYLQQPERVFAEMARILVSDGIAIVSFSNRMFYQKAIAAWRDGTEGDRVNLVRSYFASVPEFGEPEVIANVPKIPAIVQLLGGGSDPFYAVAASKK